MIYKTGGKRKTEAQDTYTYALNKSELCMFRFIHVYVQFASYTYELFC